MSKKTKQAQPRENAKREKFNQSLKVMLSREEVAERADRAAAMIADRDNKENEQKAAAKHAKSIIEQIDSEIRLVSSEVRTKSTYRQVECERCYDFTAGKYREVRNDTGEVIQERRLLESEKQMELPFEEPATNGDMNHEPATVEQP